MNIMSTLAGVMLVISASPPVFADTESTTIGTTSITRNGQENILFTTSLSVAVDSIADTTKRNFDTIHAPTDMRVVQQGLVIIDQVTGEVVNTVDSSETPNDVNSAPASGVSAMTKVVSVVISDSDLELMITAAVNRGVLNAAQASLLQADLKTIEDQELEASSGVFAEPNALSLALILNGLGNRLSASKQTTAIIPRPGTQIMSTDNKLQMVDDIEYRKSNFSNESTMNAGNSLLAPY